MSIVSRRQFFFGGGAALMVTSPVIHETVPETGITCLEPLCPRCARLFDCRVPFADGHLDLRWALAPHDLTCECGWAGRVTLYRRL